MTEYKAGDKVRIKEDCSGCKAGEICELHRGDKDGFNDNELFARGEKELSGCSCKDNRELVETAPKFKVGDRVKIKKGKDWNNKGKMDWLIGVEATISEVKYYHTKRGRGYELKDFSKKGNTNWYYSEDMFDLVEEQEYKQTYILVKNEEEYNKAVEYYKIQDTKSDFKLKYYSRLKYVRFDNTGINTGAEPETSCRGHRNITEEVLGKKEYTPQVEFNTIQPTIQQTFNLSPNKPMTLLQEMFDRFLKSNKTKIIEAVETAEENLNKQDELKKLLDYFGEVNKRKTTLTIAYDTQHKEGIKVAMKELQALNAKMNDKLFDQFFAVVKSLNKMLEK